MVATMNVFVDVGGSNNNPGTEQNTESLGPPNIRLKRADNATIDLLNPCIILSSGTSLSRWKSMYLQAIVAPDTQINNVQLYTAGTGFGTGITLNVGEQFPEKNSASDIGYEVADTDDESMVTNYVGITSEVDLFSKIVSSTLPVTISESGNIINAIGDTTNYVVLQLSVADTASPGDLTNATITWEYDEI